LVIFTLGVIPARGGSKRIPRKNIRDFCGKPLIAWTIQEAIKSSLDYVLVSTDDEEIANVARSWGAHVPFLRPPELATDDATSVDVMIHAALWFKANHRMPDYIALLQPTSPTRKASDIDIALWDENLRSGYVSVGSDGEPNGLLYISTWYMLVHSHVVWDRHSKKSESHWKIPDIDTEEDWAEAERIMCLRSK
jgi:CMP-N-acetylneuraminic acid synthetase